MAKGVEDTASSDITIGTVDKAQGAAAGGLSTPQCDGQSRLAFWPCDTL